MKGVRKVVKLKDAVAVVADSWWQAKQAVEALPVAWDDGGNGRVSSDTIMDFLRTGLASSEAGVGRRDGNVREGLANAARRVDPEWRSVTRGGGASRRRIAAQCHRAQDDARRRLRPARRRAGLHPACGAH